jgi:hypothetical protein
VRPSGHRHGQAREAGVTRHLLDEFLDGVLEVPARPDTGHRRRRDDVPARREAQESSSDEESGDGK